MWAGGRHWRRARLAQFSLRGCCPALTGGLRSASENAQRCSNFRVGVSGQGLKPQSCDTRFYGTTKELAEKINSSGRSAIAGAQARAICWPYSARVNSCPVTKPSLRDFSASCEAVPLLQGPAKLSFSAD